MGKRKDMVDIFDNNEIEELDTEINNDSIEKLEDYPTENNYIDNNIDEVLENIEVTKEEKNNKDDMKKIEIDKKKEKKSIFNNTKIVKCIIFIVCGIILAFACLKFFGGSDNYSGYSKYYLAVYDDEEYLYSLTKQLSVFDSIIVRDVVNDKDIRYDFKISNGKVIAGNSNGTYELKNIENAKKLVVTPMGNLSEFTGLFILTKNGKLYSVSLYDNKGKLITSCDKLDDSIKSYDFSFSIKNFDAGFYSKNDGTATEGIILITDINNKKHVLASKKSEN